MNGTKGIKRVFAEFDPPKAGQSLHEYLNSAVMLHDAGADEITLADCPGAALRCDPFVTAALLRNKGIDVLPHMTCRDRSLLSMQATALSLRNIGVERMLVVTGDSVKQNGEYKGVFHLNSVTATEKLKDMINIYCAVNISAPNFDAELQKAKRKISAGAVGLFTQPVLSENAFENLKRLGLLEVPIYAGILPLTGYRNACFLDENISGISVCNEIKRRFFGLGKEESEDLSVEISSRIASAVDEYCDGFYIITPFCRVGMVVRLLQKMRLNGLIN